MRKEPLLVKEEARWRVDKKHVLMHCQKEEIMWWGRNVSSIISSFQAVMWSKLILINLPPPESKNDFIICFNVHYWERWQSTGIRTCSVGAEDNTHLRKCRKKMLVEIGIWSNLEVCIFQGSIEISYKIASCPNTEDHPPSVSCLNLKSNFWLFVVHIMNYILPENTKTGISSGLFQQRWCNFTEGEERNLLSLCLAASDILYH